MKNGGVPSYPVVWVNPENGNARQEYGLTKREYFAGLAMQALVSDIVNAESKGYEVTSDVTAKEAVSMADALLAELEKTND